MGTFDEPGTSEILNPRSQDVGGGGRVNRSTRSQSSGPRFAGRVTDLEPSEIRKIFELSLHMKHPIDLSLGQPDFDVSAVVKQAMIEAILSGENRYSPTAGLPALREALAMRLRAEGIATAEHNMVTSGASGGLLLALMTLADSSCDVYLCDPYFVAYPQMIRLTEACPVPIDTYPDFHLTPERLEKSVQHREEQLRSSHRNPDRRKILIFNFPNNPTGATYSAGQLSLLAKKALDLGFQVISDEVYDVFSYDVPHTSWLKFDSSAVLIRAFSKTGGMPGWRIGYACAPESILSQLLKVQQFSFTCVNTPGQRACLKLLESDFSALRQEYRQRRDLLRELTRGVLDISMPEGGFFTFVRYPICDGELFMKKCIERELLVVPGKMFSRRNTHFRLSFSIPSGILRAGLERMAQVVETFR